MSDTAGQKAMLNFVEILMNNGGPLTVSQLAGHFGSRNFDAEMRAAAGGNEAGLKKLLSKFPSLFTVKGNLVSLYSQEEEDRLRSQSPFSDVSSEPGLPDISAELEAVRYFQGKFAKKRERWMPVASLAGHLSQASRAVRAVVGPQLQFHNWLLKHPHIFELCDNMVGLQEDIAAVVLNSEQSQDIDNICKLTLKPKDRQDDIWKLFLANGNKVADDGLFLSPIHRRNRVDQTDGDYASVLYLVNLIDKHEIFGVDDLCKCVNEDAPRNVKNALNNVGIEKFLQDHAGVFCVENGNVKLMQQGKHANEETGLVDLELIKEGTGKIYHVAKLWGIIDLGQHEHVFFDRSILESDIADLQAEYKVGETLCFRALAAPKKSRAKWKAVKIWKPESLPEGSKDELCVISTGECISEGDSSLASSPEDISHPIESKKNEISKEEVLDETSKAKHIGSGNSSAEGEGDGNAWLEDDSALVSVDRQGNSWRDETKPVQPKRFVSVGCQTMSTGDIIATNLYQSA